MVSKAENEYAFYEQQGGIIFMRIKPGIVIDFSAALAINTQRLEMCLQRSFPVFYDISGISHAEKPGRDYFSAYGCLMTKAAALYAKAGVSEVTAGFFVRKNDFSIPVHVFTDEATALHFLKRFR